MIIDIDHWPLITQLLVIKADESGLTLGVYPLRLENTNMGDIWLINIVISTDSWSADDPDQESARLAMVKDDRRYQPNDVWQSITNDDQFIIRLWLPLWLSLVGPQGWTWPRLRQTWPNYKSTEKKKRQIDQIFVGDICAHQPGTKVFKAFPWFGPEQVLNEIIIDSSCKEVCIDP